MPRIPAEGVAWSTSRISDHDHTKWKMGTRTDALRSIQVPFAYDPTGREPSILVPESDEIITVEPGDMEGFDSRVQSVRGTPHVAIMVELSAGTRVFCYRSDRSFVGFRFPPMGGRMD